jgi:hypothetical protein
LLYVERIWDASQSDGRMLEESARTLTPVSELQDLYREMDLEWRGESATYKSCTLNLHRVFSKSAFPS